MSSALHARTILSRSPSTICQHLQASLAHLLTRKPESYSVLFSVAPAATLAPTELSKIVSYLTSLTESAGCLSAPAPLHITSLNRTLDPNEVTTCTVAIFAKKDATVFYSTIPGRDVPQVGRWHAFRKREADIEVPDMPRGNVDWERIWETRSSGHALPAALESLRPEEVDTVLYFSDNSPEGLSQSLTSFTQATKIGLIASSTPFITGLPFTLFHNKNIYSSGAVGISLSSRSRPHATVRFPALQTVTSRFTVTSSEGNLVHSLNNSNPSRILLAAIQKHHAESPTLHRKEEQYYLGVLHGDEVRQLYHITSGDPSRGTIALESDAAPEQGAIVQVFRHAPVDESSMSPAATIPLSGTSVNFLTSSEPETRGPVWALAPESSLAEFHEDGTVVVKDTFLAASENGLLVSRYSEGESERTWKSTVTNGLARVGWS